MNAFMSNKNIIQNLSARNKTRLIGTDAAINNSFKPIDKDFLYDFVQNIT